MSDAAGLAGDGLDRFLAATRKGWRTVAVNVLRSIQSLPAGAPVPRELVLNLRSVTEQLEREQRAALEAAGQTSLPLPSAQDAADPLAGLTLFRDDEAA